MQWINWRHTDAHSLADSTVVLRVAAVAELDQQDEPEVVLSSVMLARSQPRLIQNRLLCRLLPSVIEFYPVCHLTVLSAPPMVFASRITHCRQGLETHQRKDAVNNYSY